MQLLQRLHLKLLILRQHDLLEVEEVITDQDLLKDLRIPFKLYPFDDALLQCFLRDSDLFYHTLQEKSSEACKLLEDFGVLKLVLLDVLEMDAVFFNEVEKRILPNGRSEVLLHVVIDPFLILTQLVLLLFRFLSLLRTE